MVNAVSIGNLQEVGITVENCCGVSAAVVFVLKFTNHSESCVFHNDDFNSELIACNSRKLIKPHLKTAVTADYNNITVGSCKLCTDCSGN